MGRLEETYKILFNERLKAICFAGMRIIDCKENPCAWKEIYAPNLKNLGVSEKTLASILKAWGKTGIIKKVKAPYPYRSKYQLIKETPEFEMLELKSEMIRRRSLQQMSIMDDIYSGDENINVLPVLQAIGKETVKDWEWFSKLIFLWLLEKGPGSESKTSAHEIAFYCFLLVNYILSSTVNLHAESREEAKRELRKYLKEMYVRDQAQLEKYRDSSNMTDALTKALTLKP